MLQVIITCHDKLMTNMFTWLGLFFFSFFLDIWLYSIFSARSHRRHFFEARTFWWWEAGSTMTSSSTSMQQYRITISSAKQAAQTSPLHLVWSLIQSSLFCLTNPPIVPLMMLFFRGNPGLSCWLDPLCLPPLQWASLENVKPHTVAVA